MQCWGVVVVALDWTCVYLMTMVMIELTVIFIVIIGNDNSNNNNKTNVAFLYGFKKLMKNL